MSGICCFRIHVCSRGRVYALLVLGLSRLEDLLNYRSLAVPVLYGMRSSFRDLVVIVGSRNLDFSELLRPCSSAFNARRQSAQL